MEKDYKKLSIYLCYILRHHPEEIGEPREVMDNHGWVDVQALLKGVNAKGKFHITTSILEEIVGADSKGRYLFDENKTRIKCCQGHSIEWIEPELVFKEPPEFLYHGTNTAAMAKIIESGHISKMSRHAVHMQADAEKAKQSAERWHLVPVLLKIAARDLYKKGIKFGVTENEVWCADDIPADGIVDFIYI